MNLWSWARWPARLRQPAEAGPLMLAEEDPFAAIAQVAEALNALRSDIRTTRSEAAQRLTELEMSARRCYREATRRYLRGLHVESAQTLAAWGRTVETCLMQLAHAHQSLMVPWGEARSAPGLPAEQVPTVLARAVRVCAAVLKWSYLRQVNEPVGVWADVCRLYALAEGRACARTPVALMPGLEPRSSIEREFLEACLLYVARPRQLRPEQVDIVERVAHFCAPGFAMSSAGDPRFPHLIDIEGGDPPLRRAPGLSAGPALRSFGMDGGERLLAALLRLVQADRIPPRSFGAEVEKDVVVRTLEHLQSCWGSDWVQPPGAQALAAADIAPGMSTA